MIIDKKRRDEPVAMRAPIPCPELSGRFNVLLDNGTNIGSVLIASGNYTTNQGDSGSIRPQQFDGNPVPGWNDWVEPRGSTWDAARNRGYLWCGADGVWRWKEMMGSLRSGTLSPSGS